MPSSYAASRGASILIGATCLGLECWLIGAHQYDLEGGWTPIAVAAVALPVALAGIAPLAEAARHERQWVKAAGFALLFLVGLAYCLSQSIDRSGQARDGRIAQASASNMRYQTAKEDRALALDDVEDKALSVLQLCKAGLSKGGCREAREAETAARTGLARASAALTAAGGPVVEDVLGTRLVLVAHLLGYTLEPIHVTLLQPMLAPVFLQLGSVVAFAFGFAPMLRRAPRTPEIIDVKARDVSRPAPRLTSGVVSQAEINRALAALRGQAGPVSNVELARLAGTTTASASRWTTRLVAEGLATRAKAGRCVAIALTAKGR